MNFRIGAGRDRIELDLSRHWIWYRLPFIGQGHWTRQTEWAVDGWAAVRDE